MTAACLFFVARQNSPVPLLVWGIVGLIAGIVLFVYGFKLLQRRRLILDTPFSKIRSASMGMVEISGQAVGPYTLVAPITARPCYYYRTDVYELKQQGKNKQWVKVATECRFVPFFIDDNTGRMLVDPRGADLDLHRDFEQQFCNSFFSIKDPAPPNVNSFLSRHGIATNNKIKVQEFCIKPKNALFILGTLADNHGLEVSAAPLEDSLSHNSSNPLSLSVNMNLSFSPSSAEDDIDSARLVQYIQKSSPATAQQIIRLTPEHAPVIAGGMTQQEKIAAALTKAGISNPAAWSAADTPQDSSSAQVLTEAAPSASAGNGNSTNLNKAPNVHPLLNHPSTTADPSNPIAAFEVHPPVVLKKGSNNKNFLISWRSQQEIARSLGWKCALMIWGGPLLALLGLYIVLLGEKLL